MPSIQYEISISERYFSVFLFVFLLDDNLVFVLGFSYLFRKFICWMLPLFAHALSTPASLLWLYPRNDLRTTSFWCIFKLCLEFSFMSHSERVFFFFMLEKTGFYNWPGISSCTPCCSLNNSIGRPRWIPRDCSGAGCYLSSNFGVGRA